MTTVGLLVGGIFPENLLIYTDRQIAINILKDLISTSVLRVISNHSNAPAHMDIVGFCFSDELDIFGWFLQFCCQSKDTCISVKLFWSDSLFFLK